MTPALLISLLSGGMLISALLMVSRMRLATLAALFRLQATLLALYMIVLAYADGETQLIILAAAVLIFKAFLIPRFLVRVARRHGVSERLESVLRPTFISFLGIVVTGFAFFVAEKIFPHGPSAFATLVGCGLIFLGLLMLITRRDMFGEVFGFLTMENGIFTFGLALSGGMPFFVEIGILFDVLVLFILVTILLRRAQEEHRSVTTDYLRRLID